MADKELQDGVDYKYFSKIDDDEYALNLLKRLATGLSDVVVWTKGQETLINTKLSGYTEENGILRAILPRGMQRHDVVDLLNKFRDQQVFLCVISSRGNIFFRCYYDSFNEEQLRFRRPTEIYKVQRRKHLRMKVHENINLRYIEPNSDVEVSSKILDISAGGVAILVSSASGANYIRGATIKDIRFRVRENDLQLNGVIQYARELPKGSRQRGVKVGIEFQRVTEAISQSIMAYILGKEVPRSNPFTV